jgi:hypothetical protein
MVSLFRCRLDGRGDRRGLGCCAVDRPDHLPGQPFAARDRVSLCVAHRQRLLGAGPARRHGAPVWRSIPRVAAPWAVHLRRQSRLQQPPGRRAAEPELLPDDRAGVLRRRTPRCARTRAEADQRRLRCREPVVEDHRISVCLADPVRYLGRRPVARHHRTGRTIYGAPAARRSLPVRRAGCVRRHGGGRASGPEPVSAHRAGLQRPWYSVSTIGTGAVVATRSRRTRVGAVDLVRHRLLRVGTGPCPDEQSRGRCVQLHFRPARWTACAGAARTARFAERSGAHPGAGLRRGALRAVSLVTDSRRRRRRRGRVPAPA